MFRARSPRSLLLALALSLSATAAVHAGPPQRGDDAPGATGADSPVLAGEWNLDGTVRALARVGNTIYAGGEFTVTDRLAGPGFALDLDGGSLSPAFPSIGNGDWGVNASLADGAGGWYIAGEFTEVSGQPHAGLVHVRADDSVDAWTTPRASGVYALARCGHTLYLGGAFAAIGDQPRGHLAAIDITTGALLPWNPGLDADVKSLATSGDTLYAGGYFTTALGQPRAGLAAIDARTGALLPWNPAQRGDGVTALAAHGGRVYAGGWFRTVAGQPRDFLAAVDAASGALLPWNPGLIPPPYNMSFGSDYVSAIAATDSAVYIGGWFAGLGNTPRPSVGAVSPVTGAVLPWSVPLMASYAPDPDVFTIDVSGRDVLIGGMFGAPAGNIAWEFVCVDAVTGQPHAWNTYIDLAVTTVCASGGRAFVGGVFRTVQQTRSGLVAIDATTGALTAWNSGFLGTRVDALAANDTMLVVGGQFNAVGGGSGNNLLVLDTRTNAAMPYFINADDEVRALLLRGDTLYAGGAFASLAAPPFNFPLPVRQHAGAFLLGPRAPCGVLLDWAPDADGDVDALAWSGGRVIAGGAFGAIGGAARHGLAALDPASGEATAWDPAPDGRIAALRVDRGTVYAGGEFGAIGGAARRNLAALDAGSGAATPWRADADGPIDALLVEVGALYAGGAFHAVGEAPRDGLAAVDIRSARVLDWRPDTDGIVNALAGDGAGLVAGGGFAHVGGYPRPALVRLADARTRPLVQAAPSARTPAAAACAFALALPSNPVRAGARLAFALPAPARVTLAVYDLAGRRFAEPLAGAWLDAGPHETSVDLSAWPAGCYLCRLSSGGVTLTRKLVVLR